MHVTKIRQISMYSSRFLSRVKLKLLHSLYRVLMQYCTSVAVYTLTRNPPENSPNLGVSTLLSEPSLHDDEIRGHSTSHAEPCATPVLPHRARTNFTPWSGEAVTYGNTAQHFHPILSNLEVRTRSRHLWHLVTL